MYTASIQYIASVFQKQLESEDQSGLIIADSRNQGLNVPVAHSIFTQTFKAAGGDTYPNIVELPVFGHSENHAGLQFADWVCSALIWPIAIDSYCKNNISNKHIRPRYNLIKQRYSEKLKRMQFRYKRSGDNYVLGGITTSDRLSCCSGAELFR